MAPPRNLTTGSEHRGPLAAVLRFCLENRPVVFLLTIMAVGWGLAVAPFDWNLSGLPRDPLASRQPRRFS